MHIREVREETGLKLTHYTFHGIITFVNSICETEYMCLYTADGFTGELIDCNEGVLQWVEKSKVMSLNLWEGDKVFLKRLLDGSDFFSLKLVYEGDKLIECK